MFRSSAKYRISSPVRDRCRRRVGVHDVDLAVDVVVEVALPARDRQRVLAPVANVDVSFVTNVVPLFLKSFRSRVREAGRQRSDCSSVRVEDGCPSRRSALSRRRCSSVRRRDIAIELECLRRAPPARPRPRTARDTQPAQQAGTGSDAASCFLSRRSVFLSSKFLPYLRPRRSPRPIDLRRDARVGQAHWPLARSLDPLSAARTSALRKFETACGDFSTDHSTGAYDCNGTPEKTAIARFFAYCRTVIAVLSEARLERDRGRRKREGPRVFVRGPFARPAQWCTTSRCSES